MPFWLSGQFASLAAVLATPGWSLPPMQGHFYNGDAAASKALPRGGGVAAGLSWRMPLILFQPNYAPETKVLGGQPALGVAFGYGRNTTEADIPVSPRGTELGRSDSVSGFPDLYPLYAIIGRPLRLLPEDFLLSAWQECGRAADDAIGPGSRADDHRR